MSCEVANSPFSDPGFPNPFDNNTDHDGDVDLSALSAYNSNDFSSGIDHSCVYPQTISNHVASGPPANPFDSTLTSDFTPVIYPSDFHAIQPSPYFQSVEQQHQQPFGAPFIPPALRNQHHQHHRRSVSEPPGSALMHHDQQLPPSGAPMIFHRDGHKLGVPRTTAPPPTKKAKQNRAQPYQQRTPRHTQQQHSPSQQSPHQHQSRYQLRRGYTQQQQPAIQQRPPTSAPHNLSPVPHLNQSPQQPPRQMQQHLQQQQQQQHMSFDHQMPHHQEPLQYVSSRVCTPAPEAVDPFLCGLPPATVVASMNTTMSTTPVASHRHIGGNGAMRQLHHQQQSSDNHVVIKMGVEELRVLMTEVVQKAVEGLRAAENENETKTTAAVDADAEADVDADGVVIAAVSDKDIENLREEEAVGDEIVVAGSFSAAGSVEEGEGEGEGGGRGSRE